MRSRYIQSRQKNGFTIIEMIIVISVIGILAAIVGISYGNWKKSTIETQVKSDLVAASNAMEDYRTFNNEYPASIPTNFQPSSGVTLTGGSINGKSYCIEGTNSQISGVMYYIFTGMTAPREGGCSTLDGLVGWWPLNGNASDFSGGGNSGTVSGAVSVNGQNGQTNGAYSFDGVNDFISIGEQSPDYLSSFTVSAWVRAVAGPSAVDGYGYIFHRSATDYMGSSVIWLGVNAGGRYAAAVNGNFNGGDTGVNANLTNWRLLTLTYDGATQRVYVDGIQQSEFTLGAITNSTSGNEIGVGSRPSNPIYRPIQGQIDDIRIYDQSLSVASIQAIYAAGAQ